MDINSNLKNIENFTIEETSKEIKKNINFKQLRKEAEIFLRKIVTIYYSSNSSLYRISKKTGKKSLMRLWSLYRDAETSRALALAQHDFSLALDSFLKRRIILTYVNKEGELFLYSEEEEKKILEKVGLNTGRANFSVSGWKEAKSLKELKTAKESNLIKLINDSLRSRSKVYKIGLERYEKVEDGEVHTNKRKRYYWKNIENSYFFPDRGYSRGEMAEGYANVILQEDSEINNNDIENSLRIMYENYIRGKKDNIEAVIKGDVVIKQDGNITLAVKGDSSSTAKIGQYIVAAYEILESKEDLDEDSLKKFLEKIPKIHFYARRVEKEAKKNIKFEEILKERFMK